VVGAAELEFSCAILNGDRGLTMAGTRKIAAILVADIVGYSRLTGADEVRTLSRLRVLWSDLIDPAVDPNYGRVIKRTGDGCLIECSKQLRRLLRTRKPPRRQLLRRKWHVEEMAGLIGPVSGVAERTARRHRKYAMRIRTKEKAWPPGGSAS
jgi:hypothetical protein